MIYAKFEAGELQSDDVTIVMPGMQPISPNKSARLYFFDETDLHPLSEANISPRITSMTRLRRSARQVPSGCKTYLSQDFALSWVSSNLLKIFSERCLQT